MQTDMSIRGEMLEMSLHTHYTYIHIIHLYIYFFFSCFSYTPWCFDSRGQWFTIFIQFQISNEIKYINITLILFAIIILKVI